MLRVRLKIKECLVQPRDVNISHCGRDGENHVSSAPPPPPLQHACAADTVCRLYMNSG